MERREGGKKDVRCTNKRSDLEVDRNTGGKTRVIVVKSVG